MQVGWYAADSSLVVAVPVADLTENQLIVAKFGEEVDSRILGRINAVAEQDVLLQTDAGFAQVKADSVIGKVLLVIPFIGKLF